MDKNELKARALLERVAQIVTEYEEKMADFRADATVQLTSMANQIQQLNKELDELKSGKDAGEEVVADLEGKAEGKTE